MGIYWRSGNPITYDEIGNPLTYGSYTYTWTNGRQLASVYQASPYVNTTYKYNDEGIRTEKIVSGVRHVYSVSGGQINREVIYSSNGQYIAKDLRYYYDAAGHPAAIRAFTRTSATAEFTSNIYYLLTNMQGDVIAIYNDSGVRICEYAYDAWGNIIRAVQTATGGSTANSVNPFRYRGYYYDTDTGLYYLQSRYYNPQWGRFLNADGYVSNGTGLLGYNMYAYCNNNPVSFTDPAGNFPCIIFGVIAVALIVISLPSCSSEPDERENNHNGYTTQERCEQAMLNELESFARNDEHGYEWASFIFMENDKYFYTVPYNTKDKTKVKIYEDTYVNDHHADATILGFYHTHPHDRNLYPFTSSEVNSIKNDYGYSFYVVALGDRHTTLYCFDPKEGKTVEDFYVVRRWDWR